MAQVTEEQVKRIILRELPAIMRSDREVREFILRLSREQFADKQETASHFDRVLDELRRDREEQSRKWWENQQAINRMLESIEALSRKHDSTMGALGARWGLFAEQSFRNGLKGILEKHFDVQVVNVIEFDDQGEVFGRPDQVELDLIVKDGLLIICEIKSSMSKSDMYAFERKVRFYEKRHGRQATRLLVISPMVDPKAQVVAEQSSIAVYTHATDVDPATFAPE